VGAGVAARASEVFSRGGTRDSEARESLVTDLYERTGPVPMDQEWSKEDYAVRVRRIGSAAFGAARH
jgi:hypothetical protein